MMTITLNQRRGLVQWPTSVNVVWQEADACYPDSWSRCNYLSRADRDQLSDRKHRRGLGFLPPHQEGRSRVTPGPCGEGTRTKSSSLICDPVRWGNNSDLIKPSLCHISTPNDRIICKAKEMVSKRFLFSCLSKEDRTFLYQKIGQNATPLKVLIDSSWRIKDLLGDKG